MKWQDIVKQYTDSLGKSSIREVTNAITSIRDVLPDIEEHVRKYTDGDSPDLKTLVQDLEEFSKSANILVRAGQKMARSLKDS